MDFSPNKKRDPGIIRGLIAYLEAASAALLYLNSICLLHTCQGDIFDGLMEAIYFFLPENAQITCCALFAYSHPVV